LVQHARKPGDRGPGGWWIFTEIHVAYPRGEVYCHDLAGVITGLRGSSASPHATKPSRSWNARRWRSGVGELVLP
jgi:hypothetical protein